MTPVHMSLTRTLTNIKQEHPVRTPKVFIPQVPSRRDAQTGLWVPTINYRAAEDYGDVEVLLPAGAQMFATAEMARILKQRFHELDYQLGDYLAPMGDTIVMAVAAAIAARRSNGQLKVLVWDRLSSSYSAHELNDLY